MQVLSVSAALGGRWAGNFSGWLAVLVPATLLVVLQETSVGASGVALAVALGIAEHLAAGAVGAVTILPVLRRWPVLPLPYVFAAWAAMGVARGIVWAAWHVWVLNGDADLAYRVLVWVPISLVWAPLYTYTLAQIDHRRTLLGTLTTVRTTQAIGRARLAQTARDRQRALLETLQTTIAPVISELRQSLTALTPKLTTASAEAMATRVSELAYEASRLVRADSSGTPPPVPVVRRAPLSAALDFPPDRPVLAALFAGGALLPLFVPDVLRVFGLGFALTVLGALCIVVLLQALCLVTLRAARQRFGRPSVVTVVVAFLLPGAVGSAVIAATPGGPAPNLTVTLVVLLPIASAVAGVSVALAVGLAYSNDDIATRIDAIRVETEQLEDLADEAERITRLQLEELLHGPVYGRLSACVMALNFHAEQLAAGQVVQGDSLVQTVVWYLEAASRDLDALVSNRGDPSLTAYTRTMADAGRGATIVIADDDPLIRAVLSSAMAAGGHTVIEVQDGAAVAAAVASAQPDLLILDARMPGATLSDTLAGARASAPDLPILILSGQADPPPESAAERCAFLTKPVSLSDLRLAVAALVEPLEKR